MTPAAIIDAREVFVAKTYYDKLIAEGKATKDEVKVWLKHYCDKAEYKVYSP